MSQSNSLRVKIEKKMKIVTEKQIALLKKLCSLGARPINSSVLELRFV